MGDAFDFMDAVQLKYPENFDALITSKKWKERFDVVEELFNTCKKNPKLDPKSDYNDLIGHLRFIVEKDANINVQAVAVKLVNALAYGLRSKFVPHASQFFPLMFERFKEKKPLLRDPLAECCDSLAKLINLETILDDVVAAMGKPNPQIKQQVDQFIFRQLVRFSPVEQPKKLIKTVVPVLLKHAEDPDKDVRDCSLLALGGILRLTSDTIFQQLAGDVTSDANKMSKVKEGKEKAEIEFAETQAAKQEASDEPVPQPQLSATTTTTTAAAPTKQVAKEPDPWEFLDPVDVLALLPKDFYEGVAATKWSERKDALDNLLKLITDNPKLDTKAQYGEIMDTLGRLLAKDSNINVCSVVAKIVAGMAKGLRAKFGQYASTFVPIIFDKFKEKKAILRDPLIEAIDAVYSTTDLNTMCDAIMAALNKPNPDIKTQTNKFLYRVIKNFNVKTAPTKTIKILTPVIVKCTGESVLEGREAAFSVIGAIMKAVGKQNATVMLGDVANDKIKMAQIEKYYNQAVEETGGENVEMVQSVHKPVQEEASNAQKAVNPKSKPKVSKVEPPKESDEEEQTKAEEPKQPQGRSASKSNKPVAAPAQKSPEPQESAGVFTNSNLRNQRLKDEKNLKALKWNFKAPTEEHTQQLMDQFLAVSKPEFVKLMFGKDFKFHLKALDQISAQLQLEPLAVMNNCDLILKWATFRFFDTNPQSLNKTLEVLLQMLVEMEEKDVKLNDADVASFLPYLLLKSGDTKDVVRLLVRKIVHQTSILHVPQKIFPLILDALTSKNSRQKAECLALANTFLEYFGISIATNQQQAMKTIAGCIAERDSNARNAALNCIGTAWMKDGDRVLTMIGNINPKEKAMLDERIKRIARDPQPMIDDTIRLTPKEVTQTRLPVVDNETPRSTSVGRTNHKVVDETTTIVPQSLSSTYVVGNPIPSTPRLPPSGKFALSRHHYDPLPTVRFTTIPHIDFGLRSVEIPPQLSELANSARTAPTPRRSESALSVASSTFTEIEPEQVERTVYALSSTSIQTVIDATSQLVHLFRDQNNHVIYMLEKADFIAKTIATQFSIIRTQHLNDRESDTNTNLLMRSLCNFLTFFMHQHSVVCRISHTTLKLFFSELLRFLCDERTSHLADHQHIVRSVNVITVKLCENSDINEGLVSQLHLLDSCLSSNAPTKLIELLQKCMFKQSENFQKNKTVPVQIDRLLTEIDAFFSKYYHNTTNKRVMDSLKLIIQRIVAATFMDLDPYLTLIKKGTPFYVYLTTCITKLKDSQAENVPPSQTRTLDEMFNDLRQNITPAVLSEIYFYCEKYPEMKDDCDRLISTCPTPSIIDYCFTEFTSCRDADKPTSFHQIYSDLVAESGQMGVSTHTNGFKHNGHEKVDVSLPFAVIPPKLPTATSRSGPVYCSTPVKSTSTSGVKQDEPNISPIPNEQVLGYKKRLSLLRSNMNN